jgi:hypothetical protein
VSQNRHQYLVEKFTVSELKVKGMDISIADISIDARSSFASEAEQVALVALAIDRLAPASLRAVASGRPVDIQVPDAETARIFRAALELTATRRATDRLLTVSVGPRRA